MASLSRSILQCIVFLAVYSGICLPSMAQAAVSETETLSPVLAEETEAVAAVLDPSAAETDKRVAPTRNTLPESRNTNSGQLMSPARLLGQVVLGLLLVTGLILTLAWLARRLGYQQYVGGRVMTVVAQLPLGNREKAVLIAVGNKHMLLGVAPGRVSFLSDIDDMLPDEGVQTGRGVPIQKGQEFARYLKSILVQGKQS